MKPLHLSQIARMTGGRLHGDDVVVATVATDTRALPQGGAVLFIALKGERFDAHDHVASLPADRVAAVLVSRELDIAIPQVVVADTQRALADFAAAVQRTRIEGGNGEKIVAITGSNGKTSVKALTLAILERVGPTYATPGNRNNEIGLPLAVLDAPEGVQFAIYEMGAGQPGDISYLTAVVRPDVSVINNVAPGHLERMGSLLGVADTKAAIYDSLPADGVAVINADDAFAPYFAERAHGRRLVRFGLDASADITARDIVAEADRSSFTLVTPQGEAAISLALPGRHNVRNALAAAALALGVGAPLQAVAEGLNAAKSVPGRLITYRLDNGAVLVDDSYNANPGSLAAAIDTLSEGGGESWLVLGDMRELGADAEAMHAEAGRRAKGARIARMFTLGPFSAAATAAFGEGATHFESHDALADALRAQLREGVRVLVKGSRGSAMDRIVTALVGPAQAGSAPRTEKKGSPDAA
ncbi:MAG TPA: UDP-N-acetylmuramoyl-tripeptide--D-alanyl-D-alanine ligase [Lysobacter sp.]